MQNNTLNREQRTRLIYSHMIELFSDYPDLFSEDMLDRFRQIDDKPIDALYMAVLYEMWELFHQHFETGLDPIINPEPAPILDLKYLRYTGERSSFGGYIYEISGFLEFGLPIEIERLQAGDVVREQGKSRRAVIRRCSQCGCSLYQIGPFTLGEVQCDVHSYEAEIQRCIDHNNSVPLKTFHS